MIALEMQGSILNHSVFVSSHLLPASARNAKVIVMYEEANVDKAAVPDILALARNAQANFPKQNNVELQQDLRTMRDEWERKL